MRLLIRILIPLTGVALIAGCSSSGNNSSASSSTSAGASASATGGQSADTAAVTQVWQSFFSKDTPISQKEMLLQNGTTTMKPALQADPRVGQASATVQKVTFPDANDADVTYQIALNGTVMMGGMAGKAIKQNGQWLVSDSTLCGLLQLAAAQGGGSSGAVPGCS
jgi:hypothetical protein